jgi:hypothetical protein
MNRLEKILVGLFVVTLLLSLFFWLTSQPIID